MADTKPQTAPGGPTAKGAETYAMGEPLTPSGPNETEDGIIKALPPEPPGEDQIGLIGGDPGESIQSTPPPDEASPSGKAKDSTKDSTKDSSKPEAGKSGTTTVRVHAKHEA